MARVSYTPSQTFTRMLTAYTALLESRLWACGLYGIAVTELSSGAGWLPLVTGNESAWGLLYSCDLPRPRSVASANHSWLRRPPMRVRKPFVCAGVAPFTRLLPLRRRNGV